MSNVAMFDTFTICRSIAGCLLNFMSRMVTKHFIEPMWLLAVPLLHFLGDYIKPRGAIKTDLNHQTHKWWGINDFTNLVNSFKSRSANAM